ncbi:hypothetical protein APHAL10511_005147 [Amanita phalloides]|nr:hypothetical protein APHAL10511_005147 [Amanita phalloides]
MAPRSVPFHFSGRDVDSKFSDRSKDVQVIRLDLREYEEDAASLKFVSLTQSCQSLDTKPSARIPHKHKKSRLVSWDGPNDPENPMNWSNGYKWWVTTVIIIMTVNVTFASSAGTVTVEALSEQFRVPLEVSYLVTTTYMLGYVFGPFIWGPGSEIIGRRPVYVITGILFTIVHLGQTLANNIQTLLVTRFFAGFFAAAPLTNTGGAISDLFTSEQRGIAASLFAAGVFLGPTLGPLVGGFILGRGESWRWVFWVMMIFAGACAVMTVIFVPETYAPVLLLRKAKRLRKADPARNANLYAEYEKQDWSFYGVLKRTLFRPFHMLAVEPILVLVTMYISVVYGLLYALFEAIPVIFIFHRGFSIIQGGLIFIGVGIGTTLGALLNALFSKKYRVLNKKWKSYPPPEERLTGAMVGGILLVFSTFWLGWTGQYTVIPWYVPALSTIPLGAGISMIFMSFLSYLVDTYLGYSASAFAVNTIIRSAVAAAFPLFTVQLFTNLQINWAASVIGLVALLFVPSPFLFYQYGAKIRKRSHFAPCIDLKIAPHVEAEERAANMGFKDVKVFPNDVE